jgi:D-alanyl-lipoteichoic acid acyltransferase DltB (MBOAT superfamily)
MLFSSYEFLLLFLPSVLLVYYFARLRLGAHAALAVLIAASAVFYASWNPVYLLLLLGSIGLNYSIATRLQAGSTRRRTWLGAGIALNLLILGYFKYTHFFLGVVAPHYRIEAIVLPLGISFFTFQQIMFLTDIYKAGQASYGLGYYAASVTFFPHLIAGPIVPYRELMPQFAHAAERAVPWQQIAPGLVLLALGLCKKVLCADPLSEPVARVFGAAARGEALSVWDAWGGALAYTFQLYFDFSGYTDMALGLGHVFGIRLPANFLSPYKAASISEFWRRWHITLSNFLRDHLYIPMGGNRGSQVRVARNLLLTMGLGGLWHGAGWTFVIWGLMHGVYLIVHRLWRTTGIAAPRPAACALTFFVVVLGWVMFRADTLAAALALYRDMFTGSLVPAQLIGLQDALRIAVLAAIAFLAPNSIEWLRGMDGRAPRLRPSVGLAFGTGALLLASTLYLNRVSEFLYFNF